MYHSNETSAFGKSFFLIWRSLLNHSPNLQYAKFADKESTNEGLASDLYKKDCASAPEGSESIRSECLAHPNKGTLKVDEGGEDTVKSFCDCLAEAMNRDPQVIYKEIIDEIVSNEGLYKEATGLLTIGEYIEKFKQVRDSLH